MSNSLPEFTEDQVRHAVETIREEEPELFDVLIKSEVLGNPEMRDGGLPLIRALKSHGFDFGQVGTIWLAAKCRVHMIEYYVVDKGIKPGVQCPEFFEDDK